MRAVKLAAILSCGVMFLVPQYGLNARTPKGAVFGEGYAEVTMEMGIASTIRLTGATTQRYVIRELDESQMQVNFTWTKKSPKTLLVTTGKLVVVYAVTEKNYGAAGLTRKYGFNRCMNVSAFTPQPSTRYKVIQTGDLITECSLLITDIETGKEPADLERVKFDESGAQKLD